ncbi:MAG: hypothetical protein P8P48_00665 [Saprospiraceae bacterium]|nr:hypothetical protein [Saprospiraceae bacterium]
MKTLQSIKVAFRLFFIYILAGSSMLKAQSEIKVEIPKAVSLFQIEVGFEHALKENLSLVHQLSIPSIAKLNTQVGKPFSIRYMNELRAYYPNAFKKPFISFSQRLSQYPSFTDYELGVLLGAKFHSKNEPYCLEVKSGYSKSLNNQFEDSNFTNFTRNTSSHNFIFNIMLGYKL